MRYRVLALDMDGTLLGPDGDISPENREWIARAVQAGVTVCVATGRDYSSIVPYLSRLGIYGPFVAVNGAEVWANPDKLHRRKLLDQTLMPKFHQLAEEAGVYYWAFGTRRVYDKNRWIERLEDEEWMMFCCHSPDDKVRAELVRRVQAMGGKTDITWSHPHNVEVVPQGVSKADGLRELCRLAGCSMEQVIAIGDGMNDAEMLREAGLGIAMGNAPDVVKELADAVTKSHAEDGVAEAIRRYIFGEERIDA